ncbi:hypothetical protein RVIR1_04750 [Candidatus Rickettsiella viridis]|uniref:Uncharacterized protein n=1 Tax=Candidatus Rickettsiella viridis TaxID=676208 RepID=A0A2Z5UV98_9COXI|nr:hypothetical protein RVIR1_04750 [Candidatus Rickettsiella viridis]
MLLPALRNPASLGSRPCAPAPGVRKEKALLFLLLHGQTVAYCAKGGLSLSS